MYKSKGDKIMSVQLVKDYFLRNKIASRNELSEETQLSLATITNILKELQDVSFIERVEDLPSTGGRKTKQYMICGQYMLFGLISLEVRDKKIRVSSRVVDLNNTTVFNEENYYLEFSKEKLTEIIKVLKDRYSLIYIGISIPGIVDQEKGYVSQSDIEELGECELKNYIQKSIDVQVVIENDVNTAILGYIDNKDINRHPVAFIYQPDNHYTGCALYVNGAIVYGATHFAGELAYLPLGTLKQQEQVLRKEPLQLLVKQIASVCAIVNPTQLVIYAPSVTMDSFEKEIDILIPRVHQPTFETIDSMDEYIYKGLLHQCIDNTRYKKRGENNGC